MKNTEWIPVKERTPADEEWKCVMTENGSVFPATFKNERWEVLFRKGDVELLNHGKVLFWQDHPAGFPYVQCECGAMFLKTENVTECPICTSLHRASAKSTAKGKKKADEELPFTEKPSPDADLEELLG